MLIRSLVLAVFISSLLLVSACQPKAAAPAPASENAKRFPFKGKVISVDQAKKEAVIEHEEIPGYMEAMTMPFPIREDWVMEEIAPGAELRAELVVDKGEYYLEKIGILANAKPGQAPPPAPEPESDIVGKDVPALPLTDQDNKRIALTDFRGKALAITFIYTRCPIPNFCPLMSLRFSETAMNLLKRPDLRELKDKVVLLSVTFDPKHDTPDVLKKYGTGYYNKDMTPDFKLWQLATGSEDEVKKVADFAGLVYKTDAGDATQINHSLRTLVIDPQGKVKRVFRGNEWSTDELIKELQAAAGS